MIESKSLKLLTFIIALIVSIGLLYNLNGQNSPHTCEFKMCPFKGQVKFVDDICGCDVGSDCWALDKIHFDYPNWSYDECEKELFSTIR